MEPGGAIAVRIVSYAGYRRAAKQQGIRFKKTPSWDKLVCAFSYVEAMRQLSLAYAQAYPHPQLEGIKFELEI
ncbi:hypothetical protein [Lyngbya confervoides]|uniref:Uncharacterized protein n=1 Tax=Lyngbya confervoides BDU141951 TaxID=1574623 RepID=A0ABD4T8T2_9CYAN|nr:hypothetical protein [Lyngbya confervoides]MCM1985016.1 hypothetical protein [Lyngbya confervoides BDU141951]